MPWNNRFQNYEAHLVTPGRLNAAGISWFGSPFFLDGFNDKITWSATYNAPNIADVYEEKLNPENPLQYLYDGAWRSVQTALATFKVRRSAVWPPLNCPFTTPITARSCRSITGQSGVLCEVAQLRRSQLLLQPLSDHEVSGPRRV